LDNHKLVILLFSSAAILLIGSVGLSSIYILDESKNATCALEMKDRNDFVVPTFNGELRTDKPVLHYYFMRLSYSVFGSNSFGARFFSGVFGLLTLLLVFLFGKKYFNLRTAIIALLILLSSIHFITQFHLATPDPYLIFFNTAATLFLFRGFIECKSSQLLLGYFFIGLGFLTKGPVSLVLPGGSIFLYLVFSGQFNLKNFLNFRLLAGLLIVLTVAAPWYVAVHLATDGVWTDGFFLKHNVNRYTDTMEGHGGFFLIMPLILLIGLLPFSGWLIPAFAKAWKLRKNNHVLNLIASSALFIVAFFSISSTKLPSYISPALPFAALATAYYLDQAFSSGNMKTWPWIVSAVLGLALFIGAWFGIKQDPNLREVPQLIVVFAPLLIGVVTGLLFGIKKQHLSALKWNSGGFIVTVFLFHFWGFPLADSTNPVHKSLDLLKDEKVVAFKRFNSSYAFYLDRPIPKLNTAEELDAYLDNHPDALVITQKRYLTELTGLREMNEVFSQHDLFERRTTVILSR
jgi:4-amino-4-deoxy-L-arabinose transferase-like glycosyltransferase